MFQDEGNPIKIHCIKCRKPIFKIGDVIRGIARYFTYSNTCNPKVELLAS